MILLSENTIIIHLKVKDSNSKKLRAKKKEITSVKKNDFRQKKNDT